MYAMVKLVSDDFGNIQEEEAIGVGEQMDASLWMLSCEGDVYVDYLVERLD